MKISSGLILGLCLRLVAADPRGGSRGGIRGQVHERQLMNKDKGKNNMGGGGGGTPVSGFNPTGGNPPPGADPNFVPVSGLIEFHACEPDPQAAVDYVASFGYPDQGDMACFADPVNACPGGCCRYANWFFCDEDNQTPHMPCVCNPNTAPLLDVAPPQTVTPPPQVVTPPPQVVVPPPVVPGDVPPGPPEFIGNLTDSNATLPAVTLPAVVTPAPTDRVAPTMSPLTPEEFAELYPEVANAISIQEGAPPGSQNSGGSSAGAGSGTGGGAVVTPNGGGSSTGGSSSTPGSGGSTVVVGGGSGGGGSGNSGTTVISNAQGAESNSGLHQCVSAADASEYVNSWGHTDQGSTECADDPVNACGDNACCRMGTWWVCSDIDDELYKHLPCVCNQFTN